MSNSEDVEKYFRALRRAQGRHRPHASALHALLSQRTARASRKRSSNVRRFGPGERIVFEPYSRETYELTREWVNERDIFPTDKIGRDIYEDAVARIG